MTSAALEAAKAQFEAAASEQQQLELLEPLTAAEIHAVQSELGAGAGMVTVMAEARKRRGRPAGVRNRKTDDFARYIAQFGQDPAITLMQIQSTPTEELVARSKLLDLPKRQMSYADAEALRIRCAEALMPYIHSKKPVAVDATVRGVIVQEQFGRIEPVKGTVIDGDVLGLGPVGDDE